MILSLSGSKFNIFQLLLEISKRYLLINKQY